MITEISIHRVTGLDMYVDDLPEPAKGCSVITINVTGETLSDGRRTQVIKMFIYDEPEIVAEIAYKIDMFNSPVAEPEDHREKLVGPALGYDGTFENSKCRGSKDD